MRGGCPYWAYAVGYTLFFLDALKNLKAENWFYHRFLRETGYFGLYMRTPNRRGVVNLADALYPDAYRIGYILARLAAEYKHPYLQWGVESPEKEWESYSCLCEGVVRDHFIILWYDAGLAPKKPKPNDLPLSRHFRGVGWIVMRSGWNGEDILFALRGGEMDFAHQDLDQGNFVLNAFGE